MRILKTLRSRQPFFSTDDGSLNLTAPKEWKELTQSQLHYVLMLLSTFTEHTVIKTYMLIRFSGIHVINKDRYGWKCFVRTTWWGKRKFFNIQTWQVESLLKQFDYIDSYEDYDVRLEDIRNLHAVDVNLHGVRFIDYLNAEKSYQSFMMQQEDRFIENLALILYRKENGSMARHLKMDSAQLLGTYLWYSHVKMVFGQAFPHFFKKLGADDVEDFDIIDAINTQIRALTDGDVTKEETIYNIPCWRALTELDRKAQEADEFNKKYNK
jgi:hypothetical protein